MRVITDAQHLRQALLPFRQDSIAFVPTMGCLHAGHVSLIRKAKRMADIVVVSIYVNPLQLGPNEDFSEYPRTLDADAQICAEEGVKFVFNPTSLYASDGARVTLKVNGIDNILCGASRPGHFDGVATVVAILLNMIQPNLAVFGEKDWQQLAIIRRMVADLHMPIQIVGSELIRETSGLAMSSRNRYLSDSEKDQALLLSKTLRWMQQLAAEGNSNDAVLKAGIEQLAAQQIDPHYLEIRHGHTLQPSLYMADKDDRIFIAATIGKTRLIDNMPLIANTERTA